MFVCMETYFESLSQTETSHPYLLSEYKYPFSLDDIQLLWVNLNGHEKNSISVDKYTMVFVYIGLTSLSFVFTGRNQ